MNLFLTFSDGAKFADLARNFVLGKGWGSSFSFFSPSIFDQLKKPIFDTSILPLQPFFISIFFRIFGISDFSVIATSFFFFLLSLIFVFLLARKIFKSNLIGILSALSVGFNYNLIDYATSGASESLFIAEIVLVFYLLSFKRKAFDILAVFAMILMYFTRAHAFIYIAGAAFFWLLTRFETKKAFLYFGVICLFGILFDRLVLYPLSGKFFIYSVLGTGEYAALQHSSSWAVSDTLRGLARQSFDFLALFKKVFYNLYNFYKLMPNIINPYFFAIFIIGLFLRSKNNLEKSFKITSLFIFFTVLFVVALSIPLYRYIHPVVPLVYILAIGTIYRLLIIDYGLSNKNSIIINLASIILVLLFGVGQTVGVFLLDSRYEAKTHNFGKPPVYAKLSEVLKKDTNENDVILTNLDTWGSWYGQRKTVWFPLEPKMIIDSKKGEIPFDAIYLTSYRMDDPNYYMGEGWREIFENPEDFSKWTCDGCDKIAKEFKLKGIYKVNSADVYEREQAKAILLIKKD
jgi:4-amino-4-deoxy-L-arabinose transferase-like glycosyltransferase